MGANNLIFLSGSASGASLDSSPCMDFRFPKAKSGSITVALNALGCWGLASLSFLLRLSDASGSGDSGDSGERMISDANIFSAPDKLPSELSYECLLFGEEGRLKKRVESSFSSWSSEGVYEVIFRDSGGWRGIGFSMGEK